MKDDGPDLIKIDRSPTAPEERANTFLSPEEEAKDLANKSLKQDIEQRRTYARNAFIITIIWIIAIILISFIQIFFKKGMQEAEFIAFLTTTTTSVFGFWWLVGRYLFKGPDKPNAS